MKKFLLCAFFELAMCCTVSAHPIKVIAPDGRVKYFESDDYKNYGSIDGCYRCLDKQ